MSGSVVTSLMADPSGPGAVQLSLVNRLLDTLDQSLLVAERSGRIILRGKASRKGGILLTTAENQASRVAPGLGLDRRQQIPLPADVGQAANGRPVDSAWFLCASTRVVAAPDVKATIFRQRFTRDENAGSCAS